ncbi:MAG: PadR family transcriptional regulator [Actinomycetia bacterium]|nr:PadR family transcriptional regulator [Actinomycetes bacterium]MDO5504242.1 PadR family transcriptional regulator [Actinomycetes bacterium]
MDTESLGILTQLRKGVLDHCVLALLRDEPGYGLDLAARLGQHQVLFASEGTLYPLLSRLRRQGWVESSWQESPAGPPRRYYTLTDAGSAALARFTAAWQPFADDVRAVLAQEEE